MVEEPYWLVEVFQDDLPVPQPAGGLVQAPDEPKALARARQVYPAFESWRVSVRSVQSMPRPTAKQALAAGLEALLRKADP